MSALYLSIALVIVAFVARDVVLRLSEKRQRSADVAQVAAALDSETQRLSETRADVERVSDSVTQLFSTHASVIEALRADVAVLKTTSSLRGPR